MSTIIEDDRTEEEKKTHNCLVLGTDKFLSGWGQAKGGLSYAAWACEPKNLWYVEHWVKSRHDMKNVRIVSANYRPPITCAHLHIYVVNESHNALR